MFYAPADCIDITNHTFEFLKVNFVDNVLRLTLNRPEKKNALNPTLLNELGFVLAHAQNNNKIWVIVIAAEGDVFCAGADLRSFAGEGYVPTSTIPQPIEPIRLVEAISATCKPTIALVAGPVYAGGFMIVGACHYVLATTNTSFSLPEVKRGLWPYQVMAALQNVLPHRVMLDLCMRAGTLSAEAANEYGLVTELFENVELLNNYAEALISDIKTYSPTAIRMGLKAYGQMKDYNQQEVHKFLFGKLNETIATADAQEGLKAFAEKRNPVWTGE